MNESSDSKAPVRIIPLVTVAMPVFNGGRYLRRAVLSVISQTFTNWELLIIDDGSTDKAVDDISDIVDHRIHILKDGANRGLGARLNEAIDLARGKYLARMDQDDVSYPERFARQIQELEDKPSLDLVSVRAITISDDDRMTGLFPTALTHEKISARPWHGFYLPHPTWMARIAWVRKYRYSVRGMYFCEDHELLLRSYRTSTFATVPEVLFAYRVPEHINPAKRFGRRWNVLGVQLQHFRERREWLSWSLSILSFAVRILSDLYDLSRQCLGLHGQKAISPKLALLGSDWRKVDASVGGKPKRPKRICFVATVSFAVRWFLSSHIERLLKDYEVIVVTNCSNPSERDFRHADVRIVHIPFVRKPAPLADLHCLIQLFKLFRRERLSAVHSITPKGGLLSMTAARWAGVPVRIHTFTGQVWATKRGFPRWLLKTLDRFFARQATTVLADSVSQREFLLREGVLSKDRSLVLADGSMCGVDTSRFRPDPISRTAVRRELNLLEDEPVVLFLGRLNRDKGVLDLAKAMMLLPENMKAVGLFVGADEGGLRGQIRALCSGRHDQLRFVDHTNRPECYMAAADVVCLPSYREGFGSVVVEAAACAVPAVASRIYGLTDAVEEGVTGLLHEPRNVRDLAEQLERLLRNPSLRMTMGAAGRERALRLFTQERLNAAMADLYHGLLGGSS